MNIYNVGVDELSEYEIKEIVEKDSEHFDWIVYWYEGGSWDGNGEAIGLHKDGTLYVANLGHCSCYGPIDGGMGACSTKTTKEELLRDKDDILSHDSRKEIKDKVRELLG